MLTNFIQRETFNGCYDAIEFYDRDLLMMPHLPTDELKKLDLVVVTATIIRYRVSDNDKDNAVTSRPKRFHQWLNWRAMFELQTVSLLRRHTEEVKVVQDDPNDFDKRFL